MLANGGKKVYLCPRCKGGNIVKLGKVPDDYAKLFISEIEYVYVHSNDMFCNDCYHNASWRDRIKYTLPVAPSEDLLDTNKPSSLWPFTGKATTRYLDDAAYAVVAQAIGGERNVTPYNFMTNHNLLCESIVNRKDNDKEDEPLLTEDGIEWSPKGDVENFSHWTHKPDSFGVWVYYNGWRFKDHYDILLSNGRVLRNMYPNADAWSGAGEGIKDEHVRAIRLQPTNELPRWMYDPKEERIEEVTNYRVKRNAEMFGDSLENWKNVTVRELDFSKYTIPEVEVPQNE